MNSLKSSDGLYLLLQVRVFTQNQNEGSIKPLAVLSGGEDARLPARRSRKESGWLEVGHTSWAPVTSPTAPPPPKGLFASLFSPPVIAINPVPKALPWTDFSHRSGNVQRVNLFSVKREKQVWCQAPAPRREILWALLFC